MKRLFLIIIFVMGFVNASFSQIEPKIDELDAKIRKHVCTEACKDGKHYYKHGEKGHVCGKECMMEKEHKHVCTDACKDGKHHYKHGEKGHVCGKECMMEKEHKHVCTDACKDGKHYYKHGEKGHDCGKECEK